MIFASRAAQRCIWPVSLAKALDLSECKAGKWAQQQFGAGRRALRGILRFLRPQAPGRRMRCGYSGAAAGAWDSCACCRLCCCGASTGAAGPHALRLLIAMPLTRWRGTWCVLINCASASLRAGSHTGRNMCSELMVSSSERQKRKLGSERGGEGGLWRGRRTL